jgi:hypothetical protein
MNFENYLSLKKALRIAVPCLALSFLASCSNEEATEVSNETTFPATNLTLTATVPVAKQSVSTRIGIKDDSEDAINYVWLKDETLTLYWKNLHDDDAHATIVYKVDVVMDGGNSCTMSPVEETELANGFYKIYSLSPHTEFNFVDGELKATIDLGNQNQPSGAVDHAYLSDKMYQYATTVVQVYEGDIISGTTNLPFEFITSLMRVRVVNNTGLPIDVSKVSLSYSTENNPQFYSKGIFTADEFDGVHSYEAAQDATLNDFSITTSKELANEESFDVYMSFFPTAGYEDNDTETLNMIVDYVVNEIDGAFSRNVSVNHASFKKGDSYLSFEGGDRHLLTLTINGDDLPDGVEPGDGDMMLSNGFLVTPVNYPLSTSYRLYNDIQFNSLHTLGDVTCPDDYEVLTYVFLMNNFDSLTDMIEFLKNIDMVVGVARLNGFNDSYGVFNRYYLPYTYPISWSYGDPLHTWIDHELGTTSTTTFLNSADAVNIRCVKKISEPAAPRPDWWVEDGHEIDGYLYTYNKVNESAVISKTIDEHIFLYIGELLTACPDGWSVFTFQELIAEQEDPGTFIASFPAAFFGRWQIQGQSLSTAGLWLLSITWQTNMLAWSAQYPEGTAGAQAYVNYRPICRRAIP